MKKFVYCMLSLIFMAFYSTAFASGACSSHGGVDCSAGWDIDGSVICSDGWKDSTVQYNEIQDVCLDEYIEPGSFYDVSIDNKNRVAIEYLYSLGIIKGYPDQTFKPENTVNRAELLKILILGSDFTPDENNYKDCFPDVGSAAEGDWFAPYVCYAKEMGWVNGYSDNTFRPGDTVKKVEAIKMLVNSQFYKVPEDFDTELYTDTGVNEWYAKYLAVAKEKGLLEETGRFYYPDTGMTRANISESIYRAYIVNENFLNSFEEYNEESSEDNIDNNDNGQSESDNDSETASGINLSDKGSKVTEAFDLKAGLAVVTLVHSGESNFIVTLLSKENDSKDYLSNAIGDYEGSTAFEVKTSGQYLLDVDADGEWTIKIEQPTDTSKATVTKSFSGKGEYVSEFFKIEGGLKTFNFTYKGGSNFIVQLLDEKGATVNYLANEIGDYEGSTAEQIASGTYILYVYSAGEWEIEIE